MLITRIIRRVRDLCDSRKSRARGSQLLLWRKSKPIVVYARGSLFLSLFPSLQIRSNMRSTVEMRWKMLVGRSKRVIRHLKLRKYPFNKRFGFSFRRASIFEPRRSGGRAITCHLLSDASARSRARAIKYR